MAEDNEIFIEDDSIALEDTDNSVEFDAETSKIIPVSYTHLTLPTIYSV